MHRHALFTLLLQATRTNYALFMHDAVNSGAEATPIALSLQALDSEIGLERAVVNDN